MNCFQIIRKKSAHYCLMRINLNFLPVNSRICSNFKYSLPIKSKLNYYYSNFLIKIVKLHFVNFNLDIASYSSLNLYLFGKSSVVDFLEIINFIKSSYCWIKRVILSLIKITRKFYFFIYDHQPHQFLQYHYYFNFSFLLFVLLCRQISCLYYYHLEYHRKNH